MRFGSLDRGLRRALLEALERLPLENVVEDMMRRPRLWKRVGERLHPFEHAKKLPNAALAFAVVRGTDLATRELRRRCCASMRSAMPFVYVEDDRVKAIAWAGPIEDALRARRSALGARATHASPRRAACAAPITSCASRRRASPTRCRRS